MKFYIVVLFLVGLSFFSITCDKSDLSTPTSGKLRISVDETIKPVVESNVSIFGALYKNAKISSAYTTEGDAIHDLLTDSSSIVLVSRKLNKEELAYFDQIKIVPRTTKITYDAVALICNKGNKDSLLSMNLIKGIVTGKITKWKEISKDSKLKDIQLIFESGKSSTVRYMRELVNNAQLPQNSFEVKTCDAIIDYVAKNQNAIGVIGVNWISDDNDSVSNKFLDKITVMELNTKDSFNKESDEFFKPYQAYIATNVYPLRRTIYAISREPRAGLATGFASFLASEKGQRIFLRSGLVPATMPVRLVEVKNQNINVEKEKK